MTSQSSKRLPSTPRPTFWIIVFLVTWLLSATVEPVQALGYWLLVELGGVRRACPTWLLSFIMTLGSLPTTAFVTFTCTVIRLIRQSWKPAVVTLSLVCGILVLVSTLPRLDLYIDYGYFPHESTFPSGHMAGYLVSLLMLGTVASGRAGRLTMTVSATLIGCVLGVVILSATAHVLWDVLGSVFLFLAVRPLITTRSTS